MTSATLEAVPVRRALLSVSDKSGLVEFAQALVRHGAELLSTGGTFRALRDAGIAVTEISEYTGFPEMLDGRVKTLHPKVHGGLLFRRDDPSHQAAAAEHDIAPIDMVVVNLYPFEQTVAKAGVTPAEVIEQIDIGGPSMVRSAAKNHAAVAVVSDPSQYAEVVAALDGGGGTLPAALRAKLASAAFARTAAYDAAIARWFAGQLAEAEGDDALRVAPERVTLGFERVQTLRYGENPHQQAAFYRDPAYPAASVASARQRHGKELSYNNLLDLDAALRIARDFTRPMAVVIKHNNPCGAALGDSILTAYEKAHAGDPVSAFGGIVGLNRPVDRATAEAMTEAGKFLEAIIAPRFTDEAIELLTTRPTWKNSVRLLEVGDLSVGSEARAKLVLDRPLEGGLLRQTADLGEDGFAAAKVATQRSPMGGEEPDLAFAWAMVKFVRSNAIVLVKDESLVGVGAGQMSRVDATKIAAEKAGQRSQGSVLASDAFFPFRDNVDQAAAAGITAIVQPGGSKRDQESIDACNEHGITMLLTGKRHFAH